MPAQQGDEREQRQGGRPEVEALEDEPRLERERGSVARTSTPEVSSTAVAPARKRAMTRRTIDAAASASMRTRKRS
jgi:hypothetical protein